MAIRFGLPLDVADEDAAHAAVQVAVDAFGRLDMVVNNAGYGDIAPFEQMSSERFKALVDTNFYGVVNVTRVALPIMRKQRSGCILQISSVGGRLALPGSAAYHAAKWAVGGIHRGPRPGSGAVWRQGMCARTRRHADELGHPREQGHS
jgi:NADP-dependent 3-hydroxy acid dehydrogenase YdfG